MKKITILAAALIATCTTFAQTQKVGHLNSVEIMQALPEYKTMSDAVEKKKAEYSNVMQTMYAEYEKKTKELQGATNLAPAVQDSKMQELKDLEKRMGDFEQKAQGDLQKYAQEIAKPLQDKYMSGVKAVAKEQGYDYVFDVAANGLVYFPETGTDLTQAVKNKIGANAVPAMPKAQAGSGRPTNNAPAKK